MNSRITVKFVTAWNEHEIIALYKSGGWWKEAWDASKIQELIAGSFVFAVAVDEQAKRAVGMGRVISDGVSDGYIQDLVVLSDYRKKGIGALIVGSLVTHCFSRGLTWIGLIAEPGTAPFYEKLGFKPMSEYVPMLLKKEF
jgi:ribosomal protein S18 acetylase RimI-like enzyme